MKHTPIWIKTKTGFDRIPYDKMTQLPNGGWGLSNCHWDPITQDFLTRHLDYFEYQLSIDIWIFMPEKNRASRQLKWADHIWSAALGANTTALLFDLYQHDYYWAALPVICILSLFSVKYLAKRR